MKKWTYLVAILAMVFATPVFTGCIDNEEPAGIEELRTAKAELLRAKAAVLNAQVDALKLKAEAEAAIAAAQAAYEQALADYAAAKADSMSATAEKAKIEAQKAAADLEVYLMKKKAELAGWEAIYEAAMKNLALAKVQLTEAQKGYLAGWIKAAEDAYKTWQEAIGAVETATQDLANLMKMMEKQEASGLLFREAERNLAKTKAAWEAAEEAAELAAELAADTLDVDKFATTLAELEADSIAAKKELADLQVERVKLVAETAEEWETIKDSIKYYADLTGYNWKEGEQSITRNGEVEKVYDDYGFELDTEGNRVIEDSEGGGSTEPMPMAPFAIEATGLPLGLSFNIPEELTEDLFTFKYSDYLKAQAADMAFVTDKGQLLAFLKQIAEDLVRDENDNAWTTEYIAYTEAKLAEIADELAVKKEAWQKAVNAYTTGAAWTDPSALDEEAFAAIEEALAAYNEAVPVFNAAAAALRAAEEKFTEKDEAYAEAVEGLKETEAEAIAAAEAEVEALKLELQEQLTALVAAINTKNATLTRMNAEKILLTDEEEIAALEEEIAALEEEITASKDTVEALIAPYTPDVEAAAEGDATADDATTEEETIDIKSIAQQLAEANDTLNAKIGVAQAITEEETYKLLEAFVKEQPAAIAELNNLKAEMKVARQALNDATKKLRNARNDFFNVLSFDRADLYERGLINKARLNRNEEGNYVEPLTIEDAKSLVALTKDIAAEWVIEASEELYGNSYGEGHNLYGDFDARLVELTEEEWIEALYKEFVEKLKDADEWKELTLTLQNWILETLEANKATVIFLNQFVSGGSDFGKYIAGGIQLEIMKGYLENGEAIEALIADIDEAIASIDDDIAAATAMVEAAEKSFTKLYDAYAAKFEDIDAEIETAKAAIKAIMPVIDEIKNAIETYMTYIDGITADDEGFTAAVDSMELAQQFNLKSSAPNNGNTVMIEDLEDLHNLLDYYAAQAEEDAFAAETKYLKEAALLDMLKEGRMAWMEYAEKQVEDAIAAEAEAAEAYNEAMEALAAQLEAIGESTSAEDAIMQGGNAAPQP